MALKLRFRFTDKSPLVRFGMDQNQLFIYLPALNLLILLGIILYLPLKTKIEGSGILFLLSLGPLLALQLGSLLFFLLPDSTPGTYLILLGIALVPLLLPPVSHTLARGSEGKVSRGWIAYYPLQLLILLVFSIDLIRGQVIDWVTGILDQPFILLANGQRLFFLNVLICCVFALFSFERTLRNASKIQQEKLKCIFIGYLAFVLHFFYLASHIFFSSYISQSLLLSAAVFIFIGSLIVFYSLVKYPFWEIKIFISRRVVLDSLSVAALLFYLVLSGWVLHLLQLAQPPQYDIFFPAAVFTLTALLLSFYLSPSWRKRVEILIARNFFRNKYDYRDLWMKFSNKTTGSLILQETLPKIGEFIADSMHVRQVAIWLASTTPHTFYLAYAHDDFSTLAQKQPTLRINPTAPELNSPEVFHIPEEEVPDAFASFPLETVRVLKDLEIQRMAPVMKNGDALAWLGIGKEVGARKSSLEDDQLLLSISKQLAHLILTHQLSDELLVAREWESFNRLSSFVLHDLKNLATQQGMILENAKNFVNNPKFVKDVFQTFAQTTDKMINLIANLSVQKGKLTVEYQPVDILKVLEDTFDDLRLCQRKGVKLIRNFGGQENSLTVPGDPNLLGQAFTNILLNAIQSFPNGEGTVSVAVSRPNGKVVTSITDTGSGIKPDILNNLFRPFQTTKKGGTGIGLCHTRSIIESHGGHIHIESQVEVGTRVEIVLPA